MEFSPYFTTLFISYIIILKKISQGPVPYVYTHTYIYTSSSILGMCRPREFVFQCHIFLSFHTIHEVLKVRMLKQFAIPFSSGPRFVRTLQHDPSILGGPTWRGS